MKSPNLSDKKQLDQRKILFVAGRELQYTRNDVLVRALKRNDWEVDVVGLSHPVRSIVRSSARLSPAIAARLLRHRYQFVVVGFYGYFLMPLVRSLTNSPIIFDAFISNYDTLCFDRQIVKPTSRIGRSIYRFDRWVCNMANHLLLDTVHHADYFIDTFILDPTHVSWVPVGCNEDIFHQHTALPIEGQTKVLHYSTFLPLHGIDVILRAADHLRNYPIHFRLIGNGPLYPAMVTLARQLSLTNVEFAPPVSIVNLADEIANAHICLGGHFGGSDKSQRVIPGKIYQMMASQRAIIAADSPANRQLLRNGKSALLASAGNPGALAASILRLHENPELSNAFAAEAHKIYQVECSEQVIATKIGTILSAMLE